MACGIVGTICDDGFHAVDCNVICVSLGYLRCDYIMAKGSVSGTGMPVLLSEMDCIGNESSIAECAHLGWGVHACAEEEAVGIVCTGNEIDDSALSLI